MPDWQLYINDTPFLKSASNLTREEILSRFAGSLEVGDFLTLSSEKGNLRYQLAHDKTWTPAGRKTAALLHIRGLSEPVESIMTAVYFPQEERVEITAKRGQVTTHSDDPVYGFHLKNRLPKYRKFADFIRQELPEIYNVMLENERDSQDQESIRDFMNTTQVLEVGEMQTPKGQPVMDNQRGIMIQAYEASVVVKSSETDFSSPGMSLPEFFHKESGARGWVHHAEGLHVWQYATCWKAV